MSARMHILEYLFKNNLTTLDELQAGLSEPNRKRLMDNVKAAMDDGLAERIRDDVTNQPAYQLTGKGSARVKNGRMTINGKSAEQNKAACDVREAAAPLPDSAMPNAWRDLTGDMAKVDLKGEAMPEADHALLASANRMLSEKIEQLESDIRKQRTLLDAKTDQIADLEASLESCQREQMKGVTLANSVQMKAPLGYACMLDEATILPTEKEAMDHAQRVMHEGIVTNLHVVAILNSAEISVTWALP